MSSLKIVKILCPYCQAPAEKVTGREIYPHRPELWKNVIWQCAPCNAYVGCHRRSSKPLGRLANPELRKAKIRAHANFDQLWKSGRMTRKEAYAWLSEALQIPPEATHIGMFDVALCQRVVAAVNAQAAP